MIKVLTEQNITDIRAYQQKRLGNIEKILGQKNDLATKIRVNLIL